MNVAATLGCVMLIGMGCASCTGARGRTGIGTRVAPRASAPRPVADAPPVAPAEPAEALPVPAVPSVRLDERGTIIVDDTWRLDVDTATFLPLARRLQGHRKEGSVHSHMPAAPPANALYDAARARSVWARPGEVCIAVRGRDGQDCFTTPEPLVDDGPRVEAALRAKLSAVTAVFWLDGAGCERWDVAAGREGSFELSHTIGALRREYTLGLSGMEAILKGPTEIEGDEVRAYGCFEELNIGTIAEQYVEVGGGRWFFDEAACQAACQASRPPWFSPRCAP